MEEAYVHVVDDDPQVRESIAFLLRTNGIPTRSFPDGEALLDRLDRLEPGCILLDLRLPRRSGPQVQAELARRGSRNPVIAMTGTDNPDIVARARAMGAVDVLAKPFDEASLLAALDAGFDALEEDGRG